MVIKDNTAIITVPFKELTPGQAFREKSRPNDIWMKIPRIIERKTDNVFNAINLKDARFIDFDEYEEVIFINAEVVVN